MRRIESLLAMLAVLLLIVVPAQVITNGQVDGNKHPNVGAHVSEPVRSPALVAVQDLTDKT